MKQPRIKEIDHVYLDSLEKWIEIPVFEETDISKLVEQTDWSKQSLPDYKSLLVYFIDLEPDVRAALKHTNVLNEVFDYIVTKNPGLQPEMVSGIEDFYTDSEKKMVREWFASHKIKGHRPEVISDGGEN